MKGKVICSFGTGLWFWRRRHQGLPKRFCGAEIWLRVETGLHESSPVPFIVRREASRSARPQDNPNILCILERREFRLQLGRVTAIDEVWGGRSRGENPTDS